MSEPFIAEIRIFAGNFAPRGWAFCNGQLLPVAQNTALFSLIGTIYGGDGRTTTGLPNLQGRYPMHAGTGPGLSTRRLGSRLGAASVALTSAQMPSHRHTLLGNANGATTGTPSTGVAYAASDANPYGPLPPTATGDRVLMSSQTLAAAGSGQPHENRQPFLGLNFIIALQGIYPERS